MNEMIDRVARAIYELPNNYWVGNEPGKTVPFEKLPPSVRQRFLDSARGAIEAMRDPSKEMIRAPGNNYVMAADYRMNNWEAEECWKAMIEAALK